MTIRWYVIVAILMWFAAMARGFAAHAWPEATVWALGGVIVAVISLHDAR